MAEGRIASISATHYDVITKKELDELIIEVNEKISEGWMSVGPVIVKQTVDCVFGEQPPCYLQTMLKVRT